MQALLCKKTCKDKKTDYNSNQQRGNNMRKNDVLKILKPSEIAKIIERDPSQVTRMPHNVPQQYRKVLLQKCEQRAGVVSRALERIKEIMK